jgi:hypothetical protein
VTSSVQAPALTLLDDARWHGGPIPGDRAHLLLAALSSGHPGSPGYA